MKIKYLLILAVLLSFSFTVLFAQQPEKPVRFVNGDFFTSSNIGHQTFSKQSINPALFGNDYYVLQIGRAHV